MTKEDEITRNLTLIEYYKEQLNAVDMQTQLMQAALADYHKAKITIEHLEKADKNSEILIPIGGGSYITAKLDDVNKVVYGVGAGVAIEKKSGKAKENIENRILDLEKTRKSMEQQLSQLIRRYRENQTRLQQLSNNLGTLERR